jgi:hypothetical protein
VKSGKRRKGRFSNFTYLRGKERTNKWKRTKEENRERGPRTEEEDRGRGPRKWTEEMTEE